MRIVYAEQEAQPRERRAAFAVLLSLVCTLGLAVGGLAGLAGPA